MGSPSAWSLNGWREKAALGAGTPYMVTYDSALGISLAVGRLTLDQLGQVRILDPQPTNSNSIFLIHSRCHVARDVLLRV